MLGLKIKLNKSRFQLEKLSISSLNTNHCKRGISQTTENEMQELKSQYVPNVQASKCLNVKHM